MAWKYLMHTRYSKYTHDFQPEFSWIPKFCIDSITLRWSNIECPIMILPWLFYPLKPLLLFHVSSAIKDRLFQWMVPPFIYSQHQLHRCHPGFLLHTPHQISHLDLFVYHLTQLSIPFTNPHHLVALKV